MISSLFFILSFSSIVQAYPLTLIFPSNMSAASTFRTIILGAPGSGKGTIAERVCKTFSLQHIVSGDILRKQQQENTGVDSCSSTLTFYSRFVWKG